MSQLKSVTDAELQQAIRELRAQLGLSQQQLAQKIGKSYGIVQRYEQRKPPTGRAILPLLQLAEANGLTDLVNVLRRGLVRDLLEPNDLVKALAPPLVRLARERESALHPEGIPLDSLTPSEAYFVRLWLTYLRTMPRSRIEALLFLMHTDFQHGPVGERIEQDLKQYEKLHAQGTSFTVVMDEAYGPKKTKS